MLRFIVQRLLLLPVLLILFSMIVFWLVDAPPGDFLTSYLKVFCYQHFGIDVGKFLGHLSFINGF